jgi:hypothetical protein
MDPQAVLALCHEHAGAEAEFDIDRVLATLVPAPRFEFFPLAKALTGWAAIERFYRHQYRDFASRVTDYELLGEWTNGQAAVQEYVIGIRQHDDRSTAYRVISMMPVDEHARLLTGERLYCDDGFVQALLGPLYDLLSPMRHS